MKKIIGLVVIVALLVLGSYYGMGKLTENKIRDQIKIVNQTNGLSAELESYHRGWFSSDALINWNLQVPEQVVSRSDGSSTRIPPQDYRLKMPLAIHHGPVIFANKSVKFGLGYANTRLVLPDNLVTQFNENFGTGSTQPELDLSLFINYLNNSDVDVSVPAFKLIAKQGNGNFDWLGLRSTTNLSSNLSKISGNLTVEGMQLTNDQFKTIMSGVTTEYDFHQAKNGLYLGNANLSFPSLVVTNNSKKIFELEQFDIQSDTNVLKGLFNSHIKGSVEKVVTDDQNYGPGRLEMSLKNLDAEVLAKIKQQLNQMQQNPDAQRQQAILALLPELPQLLNKGAEFEVSEFNFVMPEGPVEGNLLLALPKTESTNPFELIQKLEGNGKFKFPSAVLKTMVTESLKYKLMDPHSSQTIQQGIVQQMQQQNAAKGQKQPNNKIAAPPANPAAIAQQAATMADQRLASLVQSGVLLEQNNNYVVEMKLSQGQLTINGKPFNPAMFNF